MRLIDADELANKLIGDVESKDKNNRPASLIISAVCAVISTAPTIDAVPVVRCERCARKDRSECPAAYCDDPDGMGEYFTYQGMEYCSHGEPRTPPAE